MVTLSSQVNSLTVQEVNEIVINLTSTLNRNNLVHILLDMIEPKVMLQNILDTKQGQENLARQLNPSKELVCYECVDIFHKLELELKLYGVYQE